MKAGIETNRQMGENKKKKIKMRMGNVEQAYSRVKPKAKLKTLE